jgi:spore coat protein U-like protein
MNMNANMNKLALAIGAMVVATGAMATTATDSGSTTMGANAAIVDACSVGNIVALQFGNLTMLTGAGAQSASPSNSTSGGSFDAICTNNSSNTPKLRFTSANVPGTGTSTFRLIGATDATQFIVYTLKESGGAAIAYNTDAAFTDFVADGAVKPLAIAGSIAVVDKAGKKVQSYSDTITIQSSYNL